MTHDPLDPTVPVHEGENLDHAALARYLRGAVTGLPEGRLALTQFPAGASNLTYLARLGDWMGVLRRPPLGPLPPKAHDVLREARLLEKLSPVYARAPRPLALCDDLTVIGVPFYVMEHRRGVVLEDAFPPGVAGTPDLCRAVSFAVVDTLAGLHAIDLVETGLSDLGYPEGFLARQVRGWSGRYTAALTDDAPAVDGLMRWLESHIPASPAPTMIHNDFKLNNLLLAPDDLGRVDAVLDWEMATIGDPLLDLAVALIYWGDPSNPPALRDALPAAMKRPGFIDRRAFVQRYAEGSGRDVSPLPYYLAFASFKRAVVLQQIYRRWRDGQTRDERFASFGERVRDLMVHAEDLTRRADLT